jgi:hypothetical protein
MHPAAKIRIEKHIKASKHGRKKAKVQSFVLDAGGLHKIRVSIYINKRSQVRIVSSFSCKYWSDWREMHSY